MPVEARVHLLAREVLMEAVEIRRVPFAPPAPDRATG